MAGCGYVCPQCDGKGFLEDGTLCDWCNNEDETEKQEEEKTINNC